MVIVVVNFPESTKLYDFRSDIEGIYKGDTVLCDTARGPAVGVVCNIKNKSSKATMCIISRIDVDAHRKRVREVNKAEQRRISNEERNLKFYPNTNVVCPIEMQATAFVSKQENAMQKLIGGKIK